MASDQEGDRLYGLPLDQFTKARDALAARLKSAGDAEEAAGIKALKKPTTPAWAVNQLARGSRPVVEQLIAASDRLRRAQHELLRGGPAQDVWEATLAERDALGTLTEDAERILTDAGYGATRATLDKISDTLAAAAADPAKRELLRRGIVTSEMRRAGFGDLLGSGDAEPAARHLRLVPPARSRPKAAPKAARSKARAGGPTPKQLLEAERDSARAERIAARAEEDAERSTRAAERAEKSEDSARKRLEAAEKEASRARGAATAARKEAREARREAERLATRLDKLRKTSRR